MKWGKHKVPVLEEYKEVQAVLDDQGHPLLVPSGEFEFIAEPVLSKEYDPNQTYIQRGERPEWNCVGLLGQLRLRKGQPVAPNWIKMKDLEGNLELWLVR